jgi:hypothetical protein
MIDSVLNLLFRCPHRRLTRPVSPVSRAGEPHRQCYVVCLDCGKQFEYDLNAMRIGKAIDHSHDAGVVPPDTPEPRKTKVRYTLMAAVPAVVMLAALWKGNKQAAKPGNGGAGSAGRDEPERRTD